MSDEGRDITIVGGGPTGLFAAFYAGMRGTTPRVIDSLPELGGQLTALYPEKYIYDVGGLPEVLAKELAERMVTQAMRFEPDLVLDEEILDVERADGGFVLRGRRDHYRTRALVVAGGKGAFEPKKLRVPGYDEFFGRGVHCRVDDPEAYRGRRVLVVGGGDSALDWALALKERAERLILVHRRDGWRAHESTVRELHRAADAGELEVKAFREVREIRGGEGVEEVTVFDNRTDEEETLGVDAVLTFLGFKPDLGPIRRWGLEIEKNRLVVNRLMETSEPGIYGAGDVVGYEGKLDLIATGFAEAAIAVNNAIHRVDPSARVTPGHSTHMKIFQDED